jgi:hypothetical protein
VGGNACPGLPPLDPRLGITSKVLDVSPNIYRFL